MPAEPLLPPNPHLIQQFSYQCLKDLADDQGIAASSRQEAYGCLFGRDSAITILKILNIHAKKPDTSLLEICRRTLLTHAQLQGKNVNLESGEQPGKFVHEFRPDNYDRLVNRPKPWYVYPDGMLRNYDSIDSTPLLLIAIYKYWQQTQDHEFLVQVLNQVELGLDWLINYGDSDHDFLIEYQLPADRKCGGLVVQSWTDSHNCLIQKDGSFPLYPIAPIEVQAFAWLALKLWSDYFSQHANKLTLSKKLAKFAQQLKTKFNQVFIFKDHDVAYGAQVLDGRKKQITTVTANPLLCLWASYGTGLGRESILESDLIPDLVWRAFKSDLFDPQAGIRTMSSLEPQYESNVTSYHNGSFWPMLNGLIHEGLLNFGFQQQADLLKTSSLLPISYFNCPIELYLHHQTRGYLEYQSLSGKKGCRYQAWSAAAILDLFEKNELLNDQNFDLYPPTSIAASTNF
jgi:glycogen debranching enzyme